MVGLGYNAAQYTIFLLEGYVTTGAPPYLSMAALQFVFLGVNGHFIYSALLGAGFGLARQTHKPNLRSFAPFGGIHARLGTNPVCAAVPATDRNPAFVLDFATSRIAASNSSN